MSNRHAPEYVSASATIQNKFIPSHEQLRQSHMNSDLYTYAK